MHVCVYIYIYIYIYTHKLCIYIYIHGSRIRTLDYLLAFTSSTLRRLKVPRVRVHFSSREVRVRKSEGPPEQILIFKGLHFPQTWGSPHVSRPGTLTADFSAKVFPTKNFYGAGFPGCPLFRVSWLTL